jgi:hypothetical protein
LGQQFLNLVQALEVYHRRVINTPDMSEEEHEKRREEILETVPDHHRAGWRVTLRTVTSPASVDDSMR